MINATNSVVYLLCRWDKQKRDKFLGYEEVPSEENIDIYGNPMVAPNIQMPQMEQQAKYESEIVKDMFNYDVLDPRNVFTDSKYTYSAQDKDFIIIRSEKTYQDLLDADETTLMGILTLIS